MAAFADTLQITFEKFRTADLEALLDDFGSKLVHAILSRVAKHMVNGTGAVLCGSMFADVLDAPIAELTVGDNVNVVEDLIDAGTLREFSKETVILGFSQLTLSSSRQFSKMFCTTRLPVSPRATSCHIPRSASFTNFIICGGESDQRSSNNFCHTWQA